MNSPGIRMSSLMSHKPVLLGEAVEVEVEVEEAEAVVEAEVGVDEVGVAVAVEVEAEVGKPEIARSRTRTKPVEVITTESVGMTRRWLGRDRHLRRQHRHFPIIECLSVTSPFLPIWKWRSEHILSIISMLR